MHIYNQRYLHCASDIDASSFPQHTEVVPTGYMMSITFCFYNYTSLCTGHQECRREIMYVTPEVRELATQDIHNKDHNCRDTHPFTPSSLLASPPALVLVCPPFLPPSGCCPLWATHAWIQCAPLCSVKASITVHTQSVPNADMWTASLFHAPSSDLLLRVRVFGKLHTNHSFTLCVRNVKVVFCVLYLFVYILWFPLV